MGLKDEIKNRMLSVPIYTSFEVSAGRLDLIKDGVFVTPPVVQTNMTSTNVSVEGKYYKSILLRCSDSQYGMLGWDVEYWKYKAMHVVSTGARDTGEIYRLISRAGIGVVSSYKGFDWSGIYFGTNRSKYLTETMCNLPQERIPDKEDGSKYLIGIEAAGGTTINLDITQIWLE